MKKDTIKMLQHLAERLLNCIEKDDLENAYCFSHALEEMSGELAFDLYHEYLRKVEKETF